MTAWATKRRLARDTNLPQFFRTSIKANCDGVLRGEEGHTGSIIVEEGDKTRRFCSKHLAEYLELHPHIMAGALSAILEETVPEWVPQITEDDVVNACSVLNGLFKPHHRGEENLVKVACRHLESETLKDLTGRQLGPEEAVSVDSVCIRGDGRNGRRAGPN